MRHACQVECEADDFFGAALQGRCPWLTSFRPLAWTATAKATAFCACGAGLTARLLLTPTPLPRPAASGEGRQRRTASYPDPRTLRVRPGHAFLKEGERRTATAGRLIAGPSKRQTASYPTRVRPGYPFLKEGERRTATAGRLIAGPSKRRTAIDPPGGAEETIPGGVVL